MLDRMYFFHQDKKSWVTKWSMYKLNNFVFCMRQLGQLEMWYSSILEVWVAHYPSVRLHIIKVGGLSPPKLRFYSESCEVICFYSILILCDKLLHYKNILFFGKSDKIIMSLEPTWKKRKFELSFYRSKNSLRRILSS